MNDRDTARTAGTFLRAQAMRIATLFEGIGADFDHVR